MAEMPDCQWTVNAAGDNRLCPWAVACTRVEQVGPGELAMQQNARSTGAEDRYDRVGLESWAVDRWIDC
jgi:hypothetical protein